MPREHFAPEDPVQGSIPYAYTPTVPLRLLCDAACELGMAPTSELDIDPVYEDWIAGSAGETILRDVISQTQDTARTDDAAIPHFGAMPGGYESCSLAEPRFLDAIRHPAHTLTKQSVRIVSDLDGDPLLIQKNADSRSLHGVPLGLSLRELHIGKTVWPAGTLVQVRSPHRIEHEEPVTVISPDQVRALGVLRLSGFALSPSERAAFVERAGHNYAITRLINTVTMDEIRDCVAALQAESVR